MRPFEAAAVIAAYLLALNLWAFVLFYWDKRQAQNGGWRIAESTLLGMAFLGGSLGAFLGQKTMRHKTRKEPFRSRLLFIIGMQTAVLLVLGVIGIGGMPLAGAGAAG